MSAISSNNIGAKSEFTTYRNVSVCNLGGPYFHLKINDNTTVDTIKQVAENFFLRPERTTYSVLVHPELRDPLAVLQITKDRIKLYYNGSLLTNDHLRKMPNGARIALLVENPITSLRRLGIH